MEEKKHLPGGIEQGISPFGGRHSNHFATTSAQKAVEDRYIKKYFKADSDNRICPNLKHLLREIIGLRLNMQIQLNVIL